MRVLRTLVGLVLVLIGTAALVVSTLSWMAMSHRDGERRFTATLEPVRTEGYAVVVPDLRGQADRFGIGGLLGDGPLRISAVASSTPILLVVAPLAEVDRYLTGATRAEVTSVGYADGPQPVSLVAITGSAAPGPIRYDTFSAVPDATQVEWTPTDGEPMSLVVLRADGEPGLAVTLAVSRDAQWLDTVTWAALVGGVFGVLGGLAVLFWPIATREMVLVLEAHRMVDFADRIAEKVSGVKPGRTKPEFVHRMPMHDLTGEVLAIAAEEYQQRPAPDRTANRRRDSDIAAHRRNRRAGWHDRDQGQSRRDFVAGNQRRSTWPRRQPTEAVDPELAGEFDDIAAGLDEPDFDAGAYDGGTYDRGEYDGGAHDGAAAHGIDDPTGESPYVQTAT